MKPISVNINQKKNFFLKIYTGKQNQTKGERGEERTGKQLSLAAWMAMISPSPCTKAGTQNCALGTHMSSRTMSRVMSWIVSGLWSKPRAVSVFRTACLSRSTTIGLSLLPWGGGYEIGKEDLEAGQSTSPRSIPILRQA